MKRIVIVGNAGSGKSYLAQRLGAIHGIPVLDLDDLFWLRPGDYTTKRPKDQLASLVQSEQRKDAWVVEGVYGELVEPFLRTAQQLLWLDLPWSSCLDRLKARHDRRGALVDGHSFEMLLSYAAAYWRRQDGRSHAGHGQLFEGFSGDRRRFASEDDVNAFLETTTHGTREME